MKILVYDNKCVSETLCTFLINFFEFQCSSCKYENFENFTLSQYDNSIIYFYISVLSIDTLFEKLLKESENKFNAYVIIIKKENFLNKSLITIDTTNLLKKANYYGLFVVCLEISEKNILYFENFFYVYDELEKFENNCIINLSKNNLFFNKFLKMSAKNIQSFCKIQFKNKVSINNIKINCLLCEKDVKDYFIPTITYDILQNNKNFLLNNYFDKIYVLYLPRRKNKTLEELHKYEIWNYILFEGFDGKNSLIIQKEYNQYLQHKPSEQEKIIKCNRRGIGSVGSWAILKSMYNMIVDAKNKGYQRILVLQDDTIFHKNFAKKFEEKIENIDNQKWKLLYLGATQHDWYNIETVHSYYHPCGTTDGAFAVGIHCSVFDEILVEISKFNMPFDSGPLWTIQKKYQDQCYVLYENIIIADLTSSDLRESRNMTMFSQCFKWDLHNYDIKNQ